MIAYWTMMITIPGMYTMYLTDIGFSKQEISIGVTIYTISMLMGQNFLGYLVDKYGNVKRLMIIFIGMGLVVGSFITVTQVNWIIYILLFIWGFFVFGTVPMLEAWCIDVLNAYRQQHNFGKVRGLGSIGYGFAGPLYGLLLQKLGWKVYGWSIVAAVLVTLVVLAFMNNKIGKIGKVKQKTSDKSYEKISVREALSEIFKIKPLFVMIIIIFTYNFVVRGIYSYLGILVSDFGGGALSLGFTYFFDASPEVITFFLTAILLKKFHNKNIIFGAFLLQIVRLSIILIFNNAAAVMLTGVLSGLAYGLMAASYKTYIYDLAPAKYKASCINVSESIIGISGIISAPIFGFMFTKFGINFTILFGLSIYIVMSAVMLMDIIRNKNANTVKNKTSINS
jgi:MFS transporter, PPP family, 3-phenylpropionic acid transporter